MVKKACMLSTVVLISTLVPACTGRIGQESEAGPDLASAGRKACIAASAPAAECPAWAKETVPAWVEPYRGRYGLPDPYPQQKDPIGKGTAGIDLWQANHFITYRAETASYLYREYTPPAVEYRKGMMPACEKIVAQYTAGLSSDREKAVVLLTRAIPEQMAHPAIPPYGVDCPPNRALNEDDLLESGLGWCNEQARVFVRLCQVADIPARMVFLFYSDKKRGHVVSEFYADGRWCMADSSWCCVFPASDGHLMSAAECHEDANKRMVGEGYIRRIQDILAYSDEMLIGRRYADISNTQERTRRIAEAAKEARESLRAYTAQQMGDEFWVFGVMNFRLPR